jgi:hypothetical protein
VLSDGTLHKEQISPGLYTDPLGEEVVSLRKLNTPLLFPPGEDFLGFVEESVFASLLNCVGFDEILFREPVDVVSSFHLDSTPASSIQISALTWVTDPALIEPQMNEQVRSDPEIKQEVQRFTSLAFLIVVFAWMGKEEAKRFYTTEIRDVGQESEQHYIWNQLAKCQGPQKWGGSQSVALELRRLLGEIARRAQKKIRQFNALL